MSQSPARRRLQPLLSSCATGLALAASLQAGAAQAQVAAFDGAGTVVAGIAAIDSAGGTAGAPRTNVRVDSSSAVINWVPNDTAPGSSPITFLPSTGTAIFYSPNNPDFVVLNRVLPATSRAVGLDGTVIGSLDPSGIQPAGNVWFYSPTGISAGFGSSFTANGIVLTANDIAFTPGPSGGGVSFPSDGRIQFNAAGGSQARVVVSPGASITTSGTNGYALLVAPGITQGGVIRTDGSVGLVAAEQATITVSNSLFDINVTVGTSVADAIIHDGVTGLEPAASTVSGPQKVVVMATPQNTALTMLLGGSLGATAASSSGADRAVILSGGYNYNDITGPGLAAAPVSATPVDIAIGTADFNADLTALTTGAITLDADPGAGVNFLGNAALTAGTTADLNVDLGESITAAQDLIVRAPQAVRLRLKTTNSSSGSGSSRAQVTVGGLLTLDASSQGAAGLADQGGSASIVLDAGDPAETPLLTVTGATTVLANGTGGASGAGIGGTAQILLGGGTATLGDVAVQANGTGGNADPAVLGAGGAAAGGLAEFVVSDAVATLSSLNIAADALGGAGALGGANGDVDSSAAVARVSASGPDGRLTAVGIALSANATGRAEAGPSATVQAGTVEMIAENGAVLQSTVGTGASARADWIFAGSDPHTTAGLTRGGNANVRVNGATFAVASANIDVGATALVSQGAIGDAIGGQVSITVADQGSLEGAADFGELLSVNAGGFGAPAPAGGNGTGGTIAMLLDGGTLDATLIALAAEGFAGFVGNAAVSGTGGDVSVTTRAGGASAGMTFGTLQIIATGIADYTDDGGVPIAAGDGATGRGGTATFNMLGGTITGDVLFADLAGRGGNAGFSTAATTRHLGGAGQGGAFAFTIDGASVGIDALAAVVAGTGGLAIEAPSTAFAGLPGAGTGGSATITATSGSFINGSFTLEASGLGGSGANGDPGRGSPAGGLGQGGTAALVLGGANFVSDEANLIADGTGGAGSDADGTRGGAGTGGLATTTATDAGGYAIASLFAAANGTAGNSSFSPDGVGTGGTVRFVNQGAASAAPSSRRVDGLVLQADGDGGVVFDTAGPNAVAGFVELSDLATGANGRAQIGSAVLQSTGRFAPAGSGALVRSSGGPLSITDALDVESAGKITVAGSGTVAAGGDVRLTSTLDDIELSAPISAGGVIELRAARDILGAIGNPALLAQDVTLTAGRDVAAGLMSIVTSGDFAASVGRNLALGSLDVTGQVNTIDTAGSVTQPGLLGVPGALSIGTLTLRGAGPARLRAGGDLSLGSVSASALDVESTGGTLSVGGLSSLAGSPAASFLARARAITLSDLVVSGDIVAVATAGDLSATDLDAGGSISLSATGTASLGGAVSGALVQVNSSDIAIAPGATVGAAGRTALVELNNGSSRTSYYGGPANSAGYSLSAAEIASLYGDDISLNAAADAVIGTMAVTGRAVDPAGQLGSGAFRIQASGVLIGGAVTFTGLTDINTFGVRGGDRIVVDSPVGSVSLSGAGGALGGTLDFQANTVVVATTAARQSLASLSDPAAIDTLLASGGPRNDAGVLRAGAMRFSVSQGLFVQNTGAGTAFAQRRGFTVGARGLSVNSSGGRPLIVINGAGQALTGLDAISLVTIDGQAAPAASGYQAGSTINGCVFANVAACTPPPAPEPSRPFTEQATPTRERIERPVDPTSDTPVDNTPTITTSTNLEDVGTRSYEPLIDEPVTGSGNDDRWAPDCDPAKPGGCKPS
jgi:hypothetical protein